MEINNNIKIIHSELLKQLENIDNVCKHLNIDYSLHGGTLLGAVRHDGFIPWDDDADIVMTRNNFEVFRKYFDKFSDQKFKLKRDGLWVYRITTENSNDLISTDVFVLDNAFQEDFKFKIHTLCLKFLQGTMKEKLNFKEKSLLNNFFQFLTFLVGLPFSNRFKYSIYDKVSQINKRKSSKELFISNDQFRYINNKYLSETFKTYSSRIV